MICNFATGIEILLPPHLHSHHLYCNPFDFVLIGDFDPLGRLEGVGELVADDI